MPNILFIQIIIYIIIYKQFFPPQGIIELKKKHQLVRVGGKGMSHTLLVDVTRPLSEFMKWVAVKFLIDAEDIPNWSLYYKGQGKNI